MEESSRNVLGLIVIVGIVILLLIRNQQFKKKHPLKAEFVNQTWQKTPGGMRLSGYHDKEMNQYFNRKGWLIAGILAIIALVIRLLK